MQQRNWLWAIIFLIILVSTIVFAMEGTKKVSKLVEPPPLDPTVEKMILQASIQITMVEYKLENKDAGSQKGVSEQKGTWKEVTKFTRGMGTIVSHNGEFLLISHDHWSLFSSGIAPDKVIFQDSNGTLLQEIAGADLLPLILFHDGGTFILRAPKILASKAIGTAKMGDFETLNPGDIVHVVYHSPKEYETIMLLASEIDDIKSLGDVAMLSLHSLNGQSIEPGDSGGGIWINGHLAGNLWMTVREVHQDWWQSDQPVQSETAFSLAAGLRVEIIDLVETLLQGKSPPVLQKSGRQ